MIITRTVDIHGRCRVYIGSKSSVECWIEPTDDGWTVRAVDAFSGSPISDQDKRQCVVHRLMDLANLLGVTPTDLHPEAVPFEAIEALHDGSPMDHRRMPTPKKQVLDSCFIATAPGITRPSGDYRTRDEARLRRDRS